ncbi:MAG TPA: response regulator [Planctomycetota bacterium]|nr:response regulator [Planctomycetota bacterium]
MENTLDLNEDWIEHTGQEVGDLLRHDSAEATESGNQRVYVIDSDPDTLLSLSELLSREGYPTEACSEPEKGLAYVERTQPALVIASDEVRGLKRLEILDRIRQVSPSSRVIILSASVGWEIHEEVLRRGGSQVVSRRAQASTILGIVEQLLVRGKR